MERGLRGLRGVSGAEWRTGIGKEERRRGGAGEEGGLCVNGGDGGTALGF